MFGVEICETFSLFRARVRLLFIVFLLLCFLCVTSSVSFTDFCNMNNHRVVGLLPTLMQLSGYIASNRNFDY